jgi:hypothetical protein
VFRVLRKRGIDQSSSEFSLLLAAIQAIVERNPIAARDEIEPIAIGASRDRILAAAAEAYARENVDSAYEWVISLQPPSVAAQDAVFATFAETDLRGAFELAAETRGVLALGDLYGAWLVHASLQGRPQRANEIANTLLVSTRDRSGELALRALLSVWVQDSPSTAVGWISSNHPNLAPAIIQQAAELVAAVDIELALSLLSGVSGQMRDQLIVAIADDYARVDSERALSWLRQFHGQPEYDAAFSKVVMELATTKPEVAAQMISDVSAQYRSDVGRQIASGWAASDPANAALWSLGLVEPEVSLRATSIAIRSWLRRDSGAVQRWVLQLPVGAMRDRALYTILESSDVALIDYPNLLAGFSSATVAQGNITRAVEQLLARDELSAATLAMFSNDAAIRRRAMQTTR